MFRVPAVVLIVLDLQAVLLDILLQLLHADERMNQRMDVIDERLDNLEDMLRDVRRYLTGRRSPAREPEDGGRNQTWQE